MSADDARTQLIEAIADAISTPYYSRKLHANAREIALERAEDVADEVVFARRDLILEALGGKAVAWGLGGEVTYEFPLDSTEAE